MVQEIGPVQLGGLGFPQGTKDDLIARWGISSELVRTLRPTANAGGKPKETQR